MRKLCIDMDLLLELSIEDTRGDGEIYLSLSTGEFSYIPQNVIGAMKSKVEYDKLESWEKELAEEAEDIIMNYNSNYLFIPLIENKVIEKIMKTFMRTLNDEDMYKKIHEGIDENNIILSINKKLIKYGLIDKYYKFQDEELKNYLIKWLNSNNIEVSNKNEL